MVRNRWLIDLLLLFEWDEDSYTLYSITSCRHPLHPAPLAVLRSVSTALAEL
jgi:hypothetical protein